MGFTRSYLAGPSVEGLIATHDFIELKLEFMRVENGRHFKRADLGAPVIGNFNGGRGYVHDFPQDETNS